MTGVVAVTVAVTVTVTVVGVGVGFNGGERVVSQAVTQSGQ